MEEEETYTLNELAERSKVSERTIRYYIQFGLLPAPEGAGPKARYALGHLGRLRLIRTLQDQHLPLSAIRKVLSRRGEEEFKRFAGQTQRLNPSTALGYVKSLLGQRLDTPAVSARSLEPANSGELTAEARSHWERFRITSEIEVHVRRPLSKPDNRRLEELLKRVRELFREEDPQ